MGGRGAQGFCLSIALCRAKYGSCFIIQNSNSSHSRFYRSARAQQAECIHEKSYQLTHHMENTNKSHNVV